MKIVNYKDILTADHALMFETQIKDAVESVKQALQQYNINSNDVDEQLLKEKSAEYVSEQYLQKHLQGDIAIAQYRHLYNFKQLNVNDALVPSMQSMYPGYAIKSSGFFMYPAKYGFMSWHTNSNAPGKRIYIAYAQQPNKSFFRYYDAKQDKIITSYDEVGITVREFEVCQSDLLWHCVYSECDRFSFGCRVLTQQQFLEST